MKFFSPSPLNNRPLHDLFAFRAGVKPWRGVFDNLPPNYFEKSAVFVDAPESADAIILPHNFKEVDAEAESYIKMHADTAQRLNKPLFVFSFGDHTDTTRFDPRVYVLRLSTYRSELESRDIVVAATAEDFGIPHYRDKVELPTVSFCGFAGFKTLKLWLRYYARNAYWELRAQFNPLARAHKQGIYWRRRIMRACLRSKKIKCNFIVRRSFSGALRTIELPPEQARAEFLGNMRNSDFVLAPKGDGNYSNRFMEVLSMGRIPVLIDTDIALPFEKEIPYEKFVVRVPMEKVEKTPEYICSFYDSLSPEEWQERQRLARRAYEEYLRQDVFFENLFREFDSLMFTGKERS